jgi:hypothetical protein
VPPELLGPVGLLAAALSAVAVLWREHLKADQDDRDQRDRAIALLEASLANNKAAIAAWDRRTSADAARHRKADP